MSAHPRITVEGLDPFMWVAARWLGIDSETARRTCATPYDYDGTYDLREDECPDCGFDIPSGLCDCRPGIDTLPYTNGDRAEDTEAGIVRPSDAAFYTDENGG